jgi:hypothetical protein
MFTITAERAGWARKKWIHLRKWLGTQQYHLPFIVMQLQKIDPKAFDNASSAEFVNEFFANIQTRVRKYSSKHPERPLDVRPLSLLFQTVIGNGDCFVFGDISGTIHEDFSHNENILPFLKRESQKSLQSMMFFLEKKESG